MKLFNLLKSFQRDEDGAVTVDWVVLTAAIVGLGIAVLTTVGGATDDGWWSRRAHERGANRPPTRCDAAALLLTCRC